MLSGQLSVIVSLLYHSQAVLIIWSHNCGLIQKQREGRLRYISRTQKISEDLHCALLEEFRRLIRIFNP